MTLADRLRNEGYLEGVQEVADLLIKDQFADHYQILKPLIYKIKDTDKLKKIVIAARKLNNAYELQKMIEQ